MCGHDPAAAPASAHDLVCDQDDTVTIAFNATRAAYIGGAGATASGAYDWAKTTAATFSGPISRMGILQFGRAMYGNILCRHASQRQVIFWPDTGA
ncbi:hypothetical protein CK231_11235 [Mesorhizobium loti]|nr:hypothetical protein CK231_11235 [Mesorhizobium loti]